MVLNQFDSKFTANSTLGAHYLNFQYDIDPTVVGAGAFGKVFQGKNKADPTQKVAIKVMDKTKHSEKELDHLLGEV